MAEDKRRSARGGVASAPGKKPARASGGGTAHAAGLRVGQAASCLADFRAQGHWQGDACLSLRAGLPWPAAIPASDDLRIDPQSRTAHWLASRSHPDLFVLERRWDSKTKKLKSELAVDDARLLSDFFGLTAGSGGWRVAIVDAADDLNNASANALLKLIEEPPPNCLLLLVCNQPGRLLPHHPLTLPADRPAAAFAGRDDAGSSRVCRWRSRRSARRWRSRSKLSGGSPGRALELLALSGGEILCGIPERGRGSAAASAGGIRQPLRQPDEHGG